MWIFYLIGFLFFAFLVFKFLLAFGFAFFQFVKHVVLGFPRLPKIKILAFSLVLLAPFLALSISVQDSFVFFMGLLLNLIVLAFWAFFKGLSFHQIPQ